MKRSADRLGPYRARSEDGPYLARRGAVRDYCGAAALMWLLQLSALLLTWRSEMVGVVGFCAIAGYMAGASVMPRGFLRRKRRHHPVPRSPTLRVVLYLGTIGLLALVTTVLWGSAPGAIGRVVAGFGLGLLLEDTARTVPWLVRVRAAVARMRSRPREAVSLTREVLLILAKGSVLAAALVGGFLLVAGDPIGDRTVTVVGGVPTSACVRAGLVAACTTERCSATTVGDHLTVRSPSRPERLFVELGPTNTFTIQDELFRPTASAEAIDAHDALVERLIEEVVIACGGAPRAWSATCRSATMMGVVCPAPR